MFSVCSFLQASQLPLKAGFTLATEAKHRVGSTAAGLYKQVPEWDLNTDLPASKAQVLPATQYYILKEMGALRLDYINS